MFTRIRHAARTLLPGLALMFAAAIAPAAGPLDVLPERHAAPAFELPDASGKRHTLEDYRGKVLVLNFWATWCPPCRKEMPSMQSMWEQLRGDGVELVAIDFGDTAENVQMFARDNNIRFPLLLDPKGVVLHAYEAVGLPTTFVIDRDGKIAMKAAGERHWDAPDMLKMLRELARQPRS